ncbi:MAG: hypothetical protein RRB24_03760 [Armatimonadota bacterium]|mgnify:CR=1 FL=1|jgi:hypothetical protein|nr:hypothetical protein [Armatimonadota bacterium]MDT7971924.1 hypothetical protein [Armatimonadota bacterium]
MRKPKSRRRIEQHLKKLADLAKRVCPEAEIVTDANGVEEVDGWLIAIVPEGKEEEVRRVLRPVREAILEREGLWLNLSIYERDEVSTLRGNERWRKARRR